MVPLASDMTNVQDKPATAVSDLVYRYSSLLVCLDDRLFSTLCYDYSVETINFIRAKDGISRYFTHISEKTPLGIHASEVTYCLIINRPFNFIEQAGILKRKKLNIDKKITALRMQKLRRRIESSMIVNKAHQLWTRPIKGFTIPVI